MFYKVISISLVMILTTIWEFSIAKLFGKYSLIKNKLKLMDKIRVMIISIRGK